MRARGERLQEIDNNNDFRHVRVHPGLGGTDKFINAFNPGFMAEERRFQLACYHGDAENRSEFHLSRSKFQNMQEFKWVEINSFR